jgi:putative GTP pyrophosphokinase
MTKRIELPHWGSKGAINRAGEALRNNSLSDSQADALESWRMAHRDVIHTFEALLRARAKNQDVEVGQRLKRRRTIIDTLSRLPSMQLARMDDVAGCRLIFPNIDALHEFRDKLHKAKFKHVLKNEKEKYDYIKSPTPRGYRGIHDVFEYHSRACKVTKQDGLLIEIQYRTALQHAWATAVEIITQMTENEPKFDRGDSRHIRFFCVASEMLARAHEGGHSCLPEISNEDLINEFDKLEDEIGIMNILIHLIIHEWMGNKLQSGHVILQITKENKDFKLHQFDLELEAAKSLLELEKEFPEDDIVLVGAETIKEITSAFRNYFSDAKDFINLTGRAYKALGGKLGKSNEKTA